MRGFAFLPVAGNKVLRGVRVLVDTVGVDGETRELGVLPTTGVALPFAGVLTPFSSVAGR